MKRDLVLVKDLVCVKDVVSGEGLIFSKKGDVWENTFYGTSNTVRLKKRDLFEIITITVDVLKKHFEECK